MEVAIGPFHHEFQRRNSNQSLQEVIQRCITKRYYREFIPKQKCTHTAQGAWRKHAFFAILAAMTSTRTLPISFSRWLKQLRSQHDLTQEALAELVACSVQTIRFFETGKRRPAVEMAERLADVLQVPAEERAAFVRQARAALAAEPTTASALELASPATPSQPPRHLPVPPSALIGRDAEVNVLRQLLLHDHCRLVTVLGVGGIGKTRLALAAATALTTEFRDGAAFVALASLQAAHQLPGAVADALGLPLQGTRDLQEQVGIHVASRHLLLVLDNLEHLLKDEQGSATRWIMDLLRQAPELHLLVTSRERLRLSGERIFELGGLSLPSDVAPSSASDAVLLFLERAQQAASTFMLDEQNSAAINQICRLMDGMPLAIELAAAWVRILTCHEIVAEIQRSIDFLVLADRDMTPRHRSMRAVFDHSWSLLSAEEQRVLAALSVFRGGCTREAARSVTGAALPLLASLIDKSLVRRVDEAPGQARYELHELTRQYAAQHLAADPAHERTVHERHCNFYAHFVQAQATSLAGAQQMLALTQIDQELDNIRSAWLLAVQEERISALRKMVNGLGEAFYWRSRYQEGRRLLQTAIDQLGRVDTADAAAALVLLRCEVRTWLGCFLTQVGEVTTVDALFTDILAQLTRLTDQGCDARFGQALALHEFAYFHASTTGDYHRAYELQVASVALYRQLGNQHYLVRALARQSRILHFLGHYADAIAVAKEAIAIGQHNGDQLVTVSAVEGLALSLTYLGQFSEAEPYFRTALAAAETTHQPGRTSGVLTNLGVVLTFAGRFEEGQAAWQRALAMSQEVGDRNYAIHSTVLLGFSALHLGAYATACTHAHRGIAQTSEASYVRDAALSRLLLGSAYLAQGDLTAARTTLQQSIALYHTIAHPDELGWAMAVLVYVLRAQGDQTAMQQMAGAALQTVLKAQGFNAVASLLPILALVLFDQGQVALAVDITVALQQNRFVQQSVWFAQVAGDELRRRLATLSTHSQSTAAVPAMADLSSDEQELLQRVARDWGIA